MLSMCVLYFSLFSFMPFFRFKQIIKTFCFEFESLSSLIFNGSVGSQMDRHVGKVCQRLSNPVLFDFFIQLTLLHRVTRPLPCALFYGPLVGLVA